MSESELVPGAEDSTLALSQLELAGSRALADRVRDTLLFVVSGSGTLTLGEESHALTPGSAALVLAGEEAEIAPDGALAVLRASIGQEADRHAPLGPREVVTRLDAASSESATGSRSYQVLFGPANGSTRATLFAGYLPPGRAPWHFHLYDEIVWVRDGPGRLHLAG